MTQQRLSKLAALIKGYMVPELKPSGFKKKGLSWNRSRNSFIDVVNIQKYRTGAFDNEKFTLNIGIFVPVFYEIIWGAPYKGFIKEEDCFIRFRLGDLLQDDFSGKAFDIWWELKTDDDVVKIGAELQAAVNEKVLPFLESMNDYQKSQEFIDNMGGWQKDYPLMQIHIALLRKMLGDHDAAASIFEELISGKNNSWADRAKRALDAMLVASVFK